MNLVYSSEMLPYENSLTDTRCVQTTEALIVDGPNSVCGASRHPEHWQTFPTVGVFILSAMAMAAWAAMPAGRPRKILSLVLVAGFFTSLSAGFWAIAFTRADAPLKMGVTASQISNLTSALELFLSQNKVFNFEDQCLECRPIVIFAQKGFYPSCKDVDETGVRNCVVPPNTDRSLPAGRLILGLDAIHGHCQLSDGQLNCGTLK